MTAVAVDARGEWLEWLASVDARGTRKRSGTSLRALAGRVGASHQAVRRWETGEDIPHPCRRAAYRRAVEDLAATAPVIACIPAPARDPLAVPGTQRERAGWLRHASPREVRRACGIPGPAIAEALRVNVSTVYVWERLEHAPQGAQGDAYCRIIAGLRRHLEVPEDDKPGPRPGRPCKADPEATR